MDPNKARYAQRHARADARRHHRRAPTSSSACPPAACSSRRWSSRWPTSRSSWRWPIPSRRSGPSSRRQVASRLPDRHRPLGLPEPGEQLAVLPVHLPRRAGRAARRTINEEMKLAAVARARRDRAGRALRDRGARVRRADAGVRSGLPDPARVRSAADHQASRRRSRKAAMDSGVATRPIEDFDAYRDQLDRFVYQSGTHDGAGVRRGASRRRSASSTPRARTSACCARRRSRSTRASRDRSSIGRTDVIAAAHRASSACASSSGRDCEVVNILDDPRYRDYWSDYYQLARRKGVSRVAGDGGHAHAGRR